VLVEQLTVHEFEPRKQFSVTGPTSWEERTLHSRMSATSIDSYISEFPPATQTVLEQMRAVIKQAAPEATETISYAIPTFDLNGHHLVHFAGYARHIGFYPIPSGVEAFREELGAYKSGKGSVQFPLNEPLPTDLIRRIVEFRVAQSASRASEAGHGGE
jgi:uncharacterized protein YdhG (YjbR/CyaY superfamily)